MVEENHVNRIERLHELVRRQIEKESNLFMPYGIYGMVAYLIDEEGFVGPYSIPDYVVPAYFSREAEKKLREKLDKRGYRLEDLETNGKGGRS